MQIFAKYAIKYAEYAKYVILKKICRICTPHFADEGSGGCPTVTDTAPGPACRASHGAAVPQYYRAYGAPGLTVTVTGTGSSC